VVDFTQYQPPGVYVEDDSQPVVVATSQPGGSLVLVGPGLGYRTATETVRAYSTVASATRLANRGVYTTAVTGPPAIAAPVVKKMDGTLLTAGVDYTFVVDTSGGGGTANSVTSLVRLSADTDPTNVAVASPGGVVDGDQVVITYRYTNSLYYTPQIFDSYDLVADTYGDAMTSTPQINPNTTQVVSPITMAAKTAFENGAPQVMCLATNPADGTLKQQFVAAYTKLLADYRVGIIVPVFVDAYVTGANTSDLHTPSAVQGYITDLVTHLNAASAEGFGRTAIVGLAKAYDEVTLSVSALAQSVNNKRVVLAYPNRIGIYNGASNQSTEVDGVYVAAALGAQALADVVQRGLTRKTISGFTGLPSAIFQKMTKSFKDTLSKSGVCVVEQNRQGQLVVRHGVTTAMSSMTSREYSLVRVADTLFQNIQAGMEASNLIGEPIDDDMPQRVKGSVQGILETVKATGTIVDYSDLAVRQQSLPTGDPTVIEVRFSYLPALPLNYITVSFTLDLNSGTLNANAVSANTPTTA
jgi:hypothetical protein